MTRLQKFFAGKVIPLIPAEDAADVGTAEDEEE